MFNPHFTKTFHAQLKKKKTAGPVRAVGLRFEDSKDKRRKQRIGPNYNVLETHPTKVTWGRMPQLPSLINIWQASAK